MQEIRDRNRAQTTQEGDTVEDALWGSETLQRKLNATVQNKDEEHQLFMVRVPVCQSFDNIVRVFDMLNMT